MTTPNYRLTCPDGGACHHECEAKCWRVTMCGPLSAAKFPDDEWPAAVVAIHGDQTSDDESRGVPAGEPVTMSERGFQHMDPVPSEYGGEVRVFESSAASGPHIWLNVTCPVDLNDREGPQRDAVAHLTLDNAMRIRAQMDYLITHHYQVGRPDATDEEAKHWRVDPLAPVPFTDDDLDLLLDTLSGAVGNKELADKICYSMVAAARNARDRSL